MTRAAGDGGRRELLAQKRYGSGSALCRLAALAERNVRFAPRGLREAGENPARGRRCERMMGAQWPLVTRPVNGFRGHREGAYS